MGATLSTSNDTWNKSGEAINRDAQFWGNVIELGLTGLPRVAIGPFQCDHGRLKEALRRTALDHESLARQRCNHDRHPLPSPPLQGSMVELALALMEWDQNLSRARAKLVPGRVSEDEFWSNYFDALRIHVLLFYLHFPATEGAYFTAGTQLLDKIAWHKEQLVITRRPVLSRVE